MRNSHCLLALAYIMTVFAGCKQPVQEPPIWDKVKIGDLAPGPSADRGVSEFNALNIEIHVYSIPVQNLKKTRDLWEPLRLKGLRYENQQAFEANGFRAARARITAWDTLVSALSRVQAQKLRTVSFLLSQGYENDLPLANLSARQDVTFTGIDETARRILIGPGTIAWRLRVERVRASPKESRLTAYPVFKLAGVSPMPYQTSLTESSQIAFLSAAFTVRMGYGDLIVLGPRESLGAASSLGGLFFGIPNHLFLGLDKNEPVKSCPAVRVFVLTCSGRQ